MSFFSFGQITSFSVIIGRLGRVVLRNSTSKDSTCSNETGIGANLQYSRTMLEEVKEWDLQ